MKRPSWKPFLRALVGILGTLLVLSPLAATLRTQTPWNCFQLTIDEGIFLKAIYHWQHGFGFTFSLDQPPFSPALTIGLPIAWGTTLIQKLTQWDLVQAARFWTYFNFILLCGSVFLIALKRTRSIVSAVFGLAVFGFFWAQIPGANYTVYGVLGEVPAALLFCWSFYFLGSKKPLAPMISAVLVTLAFVTKPSYVFAPFILGLAWFVAGAAKPATQPIAARLKPGISFVCLFLSLYFLTLIGITVARGQPLLDYLRELTQTSVSISMIATDAFGVLKHLFLTGRGHAALYISFFGLLGLRLYQKKLKSDAYLASLALYGCAGMALYFLTQKAPIPKQWIVFAQAIVLYVALEVAQYLSVILKKDSQKFLALERQMVTVTAALICMWLVNVPGLVRRAYLNMPVNSCPVKEQQHIRQFYEELLRADTPLEALTIQAEQSSAHFLYSLTGLDYLNKPLARLGGDRPSPVWISGDLLTLTPKISPPCELYWKGSRFGILRCQ